MNPAGTAFAPAKLNLFLHVVGRRADGYHLLQSIFRRLDWGDSLRFEARRDGKIRLADPQPGIPEESNLAVRAARLLQEAGNSWLGADIFLEKHLPLGGGLGGGSSDAAAALASLNRLWGCGLPNARLRGLGLQLGADVPFFLLEEANAAFVEGVGEILTPLALPPAFYLVLMPPVQVPTAQVFRSPALCRSTPAIRPADWHPGFGRNDLEPVARSHYPAVAEHLDWLAGHAPNARMSGSGACVFAEFASQAAAKAVQAELPPGWRGVVAKGL
jgi:4-diphosphocytidyl-2-C-methyl-D-erythritol kinase